MLKKLATLSLVILFILPCTLLRSSEPKDNRILIVYNNIPGDPDSDLEPDGGFAAWIEFNNHKILFDVGGATTIIAKNVQLSNLDMEHADAIVISHAHWDHVYGLPAASWMTGNKAVVYVPKDTKAGLKVQNPRTTFTEVDKPAELFPGIWSTGSMKAEIFNTTFFEQSLILNNEDGIVIIAGCSHPGIVEIVQRSKEIIPGTPVHLVAGGFHLRDHTEEQVREISQQLKDLGVQHIAPSHCTGGEAIRIFQEEWQDRFVRLNLGDAYTF